MGSVRRRYKRCNGGYDELFFCMVSVIVVFYVVFKFDLELCVFIVNILRLIGLNRNFIIFIRN